MFRFRFPDGDVNNYLVIYCFIYRATYQCKLNKMLFTTYFLFVFNYI